MARIATGLAASTVEAWQELRIHRLRVLLSLVGVAVAVASITATVWKAGRTRSTESGTPLWGS